MKTENKTPNPTPDRPTPEPEIAGLSQDAVMGLIELLLLKQRQEDREEDERKRLQASQ